MIRKITCTVLALIMLLALLAGCSGGTGNTTTAATAAATTAATTAAAAAATTAGATTAVAETPSKWDTGTIEVESLGIDLKGKDLVYACDLNRSNEDRQLVWAEMSEYVSKAYNGGTIELRLVDSSDYAEKMNVWMLSNQTPDVFYSASNYDFPTLANNGTLLALDDYIATCMPKAYAKVPEDLYKGVTYNGKIYAIIPFKDLAANYSIIYDGEQLDAAGVQMHDWTFHADIDDVLYAMREWLDANEPDRHDIPVSALMRHFEQVSALETIGGTRNTTVVSNIKGLNSVQGYEAGKQLFNMYDTPEFNAHIKRLNQLMQDRVYPSDPANYDPDGVYERSGKQIFLYSMGYLFAPESETDYEDGHLPRLSMQSVSVSTTDYVQGALNCVSADTKNPEEACKLIEIMSCDKYLGTNLRFGTENKYWRYADDGVRLDYSAGDLKDTGIVYWYGVQIGDITNCVLPNEVPVEFGEALEKLNSGAISSDLLGFSVDKSAVSNEITAVSAVNSEYLNYTMLYSGALTPADADKMIDEFVTKQKANGSEKILAEFQKQLDAWNEANK